MKTKNGFTLIEIMIVLAILGSLVVLGVPRLKSPENNIKSVLRNLSVLSREIRNQARTKNMTHRLVFDFKEKGTTYYVEAASGNVLAKTAEAIKIESSLKDDEKPANPFQKSDKFFKGEKELPSGIKIGFVETQSNPTAVSTGKAFVYYSADGLVEKSVINLNNGEKNNWSLVINPLTGKVDVVEKEIRLKDIRID